MLVMIKCIPDDMSDVLSPYNRNLADNYKQYSLKLTGENY